MLQVFVQLRDSLYQDDAVTGEAAGLAMGLVMVGGLQTDAYQEMVQYVCDTQHDKIQRGLRIGIALLAYGKSFVKIFALRPSWLLWPTVVEKSALSLNFFLRFFLSTFKFTYA